MKARTSDVVLLVVALVGLVLTVDAVPPWTRNAEAIPLAEVRKQFCWAL